MINQKNPRPRIGFKKEVYVSHTKNTSQINHFYLALTKAFDNFLRDEANGYLYNELRFVKQVESIRKIYKEEREQFMTQKGDQ